MKKLLFLLFMFFPLFAEENPPKPPEKYEMVHDLESLGIDYKSATMIVNGVQKIEKDSAIKAYFKDLAKIAGYTGVVSAGLIFTFVMCSLFNEFPDILKRRQEEESPI